MASVKPISLTVETLDIDGDKIPDKVSFSVMQTKEQSFSVEVSTDGSKDSFGNPVKTTKKIDVDTVPNWHLSSLRFENNKLVLCGEDAGKKKSEESVALGHLIEGAPSVGTQYGSGGLGARGEGWGGGGNFDKSLIDRVVKQRLPEIRYAYQKALDSNPDLTRKIVVKFTIDRNGSVTGATVKSSEENQPEAVKKMEKEICDQFLRMKFPAPEGGGILPISYPLNFEPHVTK